MTILPQIQPSFPPRLMLPAPPQPKLLCAPKISGLLPARVGMPPIEVTPPQSMRVKRMTTKELDKFFEDGLGRPARTIEQMREELRELGIEDAQPDPFRVLPSTSGPIEITPSGFRSRWFKRMTDGELDAMFGPVLTIEEFEEKFRRERQGRRAASSIDAVEEGQP